MFRSATILSLVFVYCATPVAQAQKMYWVDQNARKIQRADLDGSNIEDLVTAGLDNPQGLALDLTGSKIYWVDHDAQLIQRANLDGSDVETILLIAPTRPQGIAVDSVGARIYWTATGPGGIHRANLNGSNPELLVASGLSNPIGIALDIVGGRMYWTDPEGDRKIQSANLDGTDVTTLIDDGALGIALDLMAGKLYLAKGNEIWRANLDGSDIEVLVPFPSALIWGIALDVDCGKMYWGNQDTTKLQRADLDGTNIEDLVTGLLGPRGVALDHQTLNAPLPLPNAVETNRYLQFTGNNPGQTSAVRLTFQQLPSPYDIFNGESLWVGQPQEVSEHSSSVNPDEVPAWSTFWTATLQCTPAYVDWSQYDSVAIYHELIVPDGVYALQAVDEFCDELSEASYSSPLALTTSRWGDVVKDCQTTPCGPPDGSVDIITDAIAVLRKFSNLPGAPLKARTDLEPATPDRRINITDVLAVIGGFVGGSYPFDPPLWPCN